MWKKKIGHVTLVKAVSFSDSGEAPELTRVGLGLAVDQSDWANSPVWCQGWVLGYIYNWGNKARRSGEAFSVLHLHLITPYRPRWPPLFREQKYMKMHLQIAHSGLTEKHSSVFLLASIIRYNDREAFVTFLYSANCLNKKFILEAFTEF